MCIVSEFLQWLNDQLEKGKEKGGERMKKSKTRLSPREWAGGIFVILSWIPFSAVNADEPWQLIAAFALGIVIMATGALILNWPKMKNCLQKENAPSRAATRTRRTEKPSTYRLAESEENVNV